MENAFAQIADLTTREQALLQFLSQIALHTDAQETDVKAVGFDDKQIRALKEGLNQLERGSSSSSPTLSALLAKTLKSSCCS